MRPQSDMWPDTSQVPQDRSDQLITSSYSHSVTLFKSVTEPFHLSICSGNLPLNKFIEQADGQMRGRRCAQPCSYDWAAAVNFGGEEDGGKMT